MQGIFSLPPRPAFPAAREVGRGPVGADRAAFPCGRGEHRRQGSSTFRFLISVGTRGQGGVGEPDAGAHPAAGRWGEAGQSPVRLPSSRDLLVQGPFPHFRPPAQPRVGGFPHPVITPVHLGPPGRVRSRPARGRASPTQARATEGHRVPTLLGRRPETSPAEGRRTVSGVPASDQALLVMSDATHTQGRGGGGPVAPARQR